jgi:hypothetical protein
VSDGAAENPLTRYGAMVELAERQLDAARRGETEQLEELAAAWDRLALELPHEPPPGAAPLLKAAAALVQRTKEQLANAREALMKDIALTARAGRAARGYRTGGGAGSRVDRCA